MNKSVKRSNAAHQHRIEFLKRKPGKWNSRKIGYHYKVINRQENENRVLSKIERRKLY